MPLFKRKRPGGRLEQIAAAEQAKVAAEEALAEAHRRRPTVEYFVSYTKNRRKQNGFGDDFTISTTPRGFKHDAASAR